MSKLLIKVFLCTCRAPNRFALYTRWGRVGEVGADNLNSTLDEETGKKMFGKKFQDKTKNKWEKKDNFTAVPGKYTLLEMDDDDEDEEVQGMC